MKPANSMVRYLAYPGVMGAVAAVLAIVAAGHWQPAWALPLSVLVGIAVVAGLERSFPFEHVWLRDHGDTVADALHALVNLALLAGAAYGLAALPMPAIGWWPAAWPLWAQVLLAGVVFDLGLYVMHRVSHRVPWAWRLHAIHHSSERLYWLNGERRHPLSALLMAAPGLLVAVTLGAPALAFSLWFTLLAVHLAFQHSNLDYTLGPLRRWIGTAEVHRWHHKRDYEDAQVNFGEFLMLWDRLFGTYADPPERIGAGDVGLQDRSFPPGYVAQLRWPFARNTRSVR